MTTPKDDSFLEGLKTLAEATLARSMNCLAFSDDDMDVPSTVEVNAEELLNLISRIGELERNQRTPGTVEVCALGGCGRQEHCVATNCPLEKN